MWTIRALVRRSTELLVIVALGACAKKPAPAKPDTLDLEPERVRAGVPAIAYAAFSKSGTVIEGAVGGGATPRMRFHAASIAKLILACAVLQAEEKGRVDLSAPVARHVPKAPASITLEQLLYHRSGIVDPPDLAEDRPLTFETYLDELLPGVVLAERRTRYSNVGAALAALTLERATGIEYATLVRDGIFLPLEMGTASFSPDGVVAAAHVGSRAIAPTVHRHVYPASDLFVSAHDLARFGRALLLWGELDGKQILDSASVRRMTTGTSEDWAQALGFQLRSFAGHHVVGHEGEDVGTSSAFYLDQESGVGAVLLANGDALASGDQARIGAISAGIEKLLRAVRYGGIP